MWRPRPTRPLSNPVVPRLCQKRAILNDKSISAIVKKGEFRNPWWDNLVERLQIVTGANNKLMEWWEKVIHILLGEKRPGVQDVRLGIDEFASALHYAEMCADPEQRERKGLGILKNPGGYIAGKVMKYARRERISLPENPLS